MTAQKPLSAPDRARPVRRTFESAAAAVGVSLVLAACGSGSSRPAAARVSVGGASASCTGVPGAHHARVIVETSPSAVLQRCVGFSSPTVSATAVLSDAHVTLGTQKYSFGLAICQVDGVPAHYSQCLPSGQPYWALFVSRNGEVWSSASAGISGTTLKPGDSLGLRYDSPTGNPAPPPAPNPA